MKPTVVIVGRPNVGKSTLFNRLTRSRAALVADTPGLTRDRHYGHGEMGDKPFLVVDTGGLEPKGPNGLALEAARQTELALNEADVVIFLVDAKTGLTPQDTRIAQQLRSRGRPVVLAVNKSEGMVAERAIADFHELALGEPIPISAEHGRNIEHLLEAGLLPFSDEGQEDTSPARPKVAVVGRPNVGKSTLVNALLGEERVIVFDEPGTTRDSIEIEFEHAGERFTLVDTAGVRRRGRIADVVEKFSVIKTLQAIEAADVVMLVLDAEQGIAEQDAHIASFILEAHRALVVVINKWDSVGNDQRARVKRELRRKLPFLGFAEFHFVSALKKEGLKALFASIRAAYASAMKKLPTPKLTRALRLAVERQQPPRSGTLRPKLRYAHQGGTNPPTIVIHGNSLAKVPMSYKRYLEHFFRETFQLTGTPLKVVFKSGVNPYQSR